MSRPNKKVKCIICSNEVQYINTLYIEHEVDDKTIIAGRACRNHMETKNYLRDSLCSEMRQKAIDYVTLELLHMESTHARNIDMFIKDKKKYHHPYIIKKLKQKIKESIPPIMFSLKLFIRIMKICYRVYKLYNMANKIQYRATTNELYTFRKKFLSQPERR